jgi:putative membrane protein
MKTRQVIVGIAVGLVLLLVVGLLAGSSLWGRSYYHHGPGMMWDDGFYGGMHSFGGGAATILFWILLLAAVIGGAALLIGGLARQASRTAEGEDASLEILRQRYARGDIGREEFERMREALG